MFAFINSRLSFYFKFNNLQEPIYIHFIVNPISGKGKHTITKAYLDSCFSSEKYKIEIDYTAYKKHAIALTKNAVAKRPTVIVACGGDGTIHEVASELVNRDISLGIIPIGSGNGLASNLKISKEIEKAIALLLKGNRSSMDVGKAGNQYFFSNMGLGIDAMIIKKYESQNKRSFFTYIKAALKSTFEYVPQTFKVSYNGCTLKTKPFLLFISNSNEMGYKMSLTPKASLQDGLLDFLLISRVNFIEKMYLGILIFFNKPDFFHKYKHRLLSEITIKTESNSNIEMQLDGEYYNLESNELLVSVLPNALKIICN